jgi:voltage-gated sodium channel
MVNHMVHWCQKVVTSKSFNRIILTLIVLSGLLVGLETYPQFGITTSIGQSILLVQDIILGIFVLEIAVKIIAYGSKPWRYFQNPWNVFDFCIVAISLLPVGRFAVVFRMARLLRVLRLFTALPRLQILVTALLRSIPSLGYVGILLLLHFYIYAVMGSFLFSHNDPIRFGNLQKSMMTLFQVLTLEGWNDVLNTQMLGSDATYDEEWRELAGPARHSQPQPAAAAAYFVSFIMLGTMIMLNLFTGVIIGSMEEARDYCSGKAADEVEDRIKELEERGFMTLRDELQLVAHHLREVSEDINALKQQTAQLRMESLTPGGIAAVDAEGSAKQMFRVGQGK